MTKFRVLALVALFCRKLKNSFRTIRLPLGGKNKLHTIICVRDLPLLSTYTLSEVTQNGKTYARCRRTIDGRQEDIRLHTLISGRPPKNLVTDHRDGDGLNNTRVNLRHVTRSINAQNRPKATTVQYTGVQRSSEGSRWIARHRLNHKAYYLGMFDTAIEAGKTVDRFVLFHRGVEGHTNNLLTSDEIKEALVTKPIIKSKRQGRTLPKHISLRPNGKYVVVFKDAKRKTSNTFAKLSDASAFADKKRLEYEKLDDEELKREGILRNPMGIAHIPLNESKTPDFVLVDDSTYWNIRKFSWSAKSSDEPPRGKPDGRLMLLHRYVYEQHVGPIPDDSYVDHINGDLRDVRLINLRTLLPGASGQNRRKRKGTAHKLIGTRFFENCPFKPWHAVITVDRKVRSLGFYATEELAAQAYDDAAIAAYPNHTPKLNFPKRLRVDAPGPEAPSVVAIPLQ